MVKWRIIARIYIVSKIGRKYYEVVTLVGYTFYPIKRWYGQHIFKKSFVGVFETERDFG